MKITKYLHACLYLEDQDTNVLIDPGVYTYQENVFPFDSIKKLDYIGITHEHADHMDVQFLQELISRFPLVKIITNVGAAKALESHDIPSSTLDNQVLTLTSAKHERVFDHDVPENAAIRVFNRFTHPGDSLAFTTTSAILALPLVGPSWMITQAVEKALDLRPKYIIPIHDFHWKDSFRQEFYQRLGHFFAGNDIVFFPTETGQTIEI